MRYMLVAIVLWVGGCDRAAPTPAPGSSPASAPQSKPPSVVAATSPTSNASSQPQPDALAGDHLRRHPGSDPSSPCTCETDKRRNGWCWKCNAGYIAGHRVENARLFETLDPHGHDLDLQSLQLQMCREAIAADAWCEEVGFGFVRGKAFFTRLTFGLAKGTAVDVAAVDCEMCRGGDVEPKWCERCVAGGRGMVGNVAIGNRDLLIATAREYHVFLKAIEKANTCEWCAAAMVVHRMCPFCRISYEGDEPVQLPGRGPTTLPQSGPSSSSP